jgi:hypothetical protein
MYEAVYGPYDWNCYPLAPPGCKAVIYESPRTRGSWASHGTDAWYLGPSVDHYQCNHFFVPDTRAYRVSGSAELFPQHCQDPFLLWNENFQEVIDELATTIREVPPNQRAKLFNLVYKHLQLDKSNDSPRTLTDASHTWMLPQGDIQLNPYVPSPNE